MNTLFYTFLNHLHSIVRWFLIAGLLISIISALVSLSRQTYMPLKVRMFCRYTVYLAHLQLVAGLILYFISPKVIFSAASMGSPVLRFYLVEHITAMIISIALITAGYVLMKREADPVRAARKIIWYYLISLILILAMIPWPFTRYGGHWI